MNLLKTTFGNLEFKSPLLIGSGQYTTSIGQIGIHADKIAAKGWGGIVTKSVIRKYGLQFKPHLWTSPEYRFFAMQNSGPAFSEFSSELLNDVKKDALSCRKAGIRLIVSIMGNSLAEWAELAIAMEKAGADALELNLSCPSPRETIKKSMGAMHIGQSPEKTFQVAKAVKKAVNIPVWAKLTANYQDVPAVASSCKMAGLDAVSAINTIPGIIGIDIETGIPFSSDISGKSYLSGLSGPLIKPIALGIVAEISKNTDIPVCGIGGIIKWKDVLEFFYAGAGLVQICTGVMWYGFSLGEKILVGVSQFLKRKKYISINDIKSKAINYLNSNIPNQYFKESRLLLDKQKCNGCGLCITACRDSAYHAISYTKNNIEINPDLCQLCGLCMVVCKKGAISLVDLL